MTNAYTPGPWTVNHLTVKNADGHSIASAGNNRKLCGAELEASLRLMAAAPALVQYLETILFAATTDADNNNGIVDRRAVAMLAREALELAGVA